MFFARPQLPAAERPDDDFPYVLNIGRVAHQWHTLTETGKVAKLNRLNPGPFVELHPTTARRWASATATRTRSRRAAAARCSRRSSPTGCGPGLASPRSDVSGERLSINAVTSDAVDAISFQPEFKTAAVSLRPAPTPSG